MAEVNADYFLPSGEKVNFSTNAESVKESENKQFISKDLKNHLEKIKGKEVLNEKITTNIRDFDKTKIPNLSALQEIIESLDNLKIKIVISSTQPDPIPGKNILWIKKEG